VHELDEAWQRYARLKREQDNWREDEEGLCLKESLALLPNVSEASVTFAMSFCGRTNDWPVWTRLQPLILMGPDGWIYGSDWSQSDMLGTNVILSAHGQAALCLLEAIGYRDSFSGTRPITKLDIDMRHHEPYQNLLGATTGHGKQPDMLPHLTRFRIINGIFCRLTDLRLSNPTFGGSEDSEEELEDFEEEFRQGYLEQTASNKLIASETIGFLRAAKQLRRLTLVFTQWNLSTAKPLAPLFDCSDDEVVWPNLEHLSLSTNVRPAMFLTFLRNHAATLRSLEVRDSFLYDVQQVLEEIPRILQLKHVYIEGVWHDGSREGFFDLDACTEMLSEGTDCDGPYEKAVKGYLLGESASLPEILCDGGTGTRPRMLE